jgi:ribosome biogenesis GTPase A
MELAHTDGTSDSPDTLEAADWTRVELARCLSDTAQFPGVDLGACELLHQKFSEMIFNLVVAGQFKRGKSSVINALLGEPVLPTGVVPLTSIVTAVRYGTSLAARVQGEDGHERVISPDALNTYVTERGNPHNIQRVRQVLVDHPSRWLANGVYLVDTPGIGSVYEHNTDVAQRYLPQADAVLFIASVDQPLGSAELDFLVSIRQHADKIFCLLNKADYLDAEELCESVSFATEQIRSTLGPAAPLFAVSAKLALQGKREGNTEALTRSGFPLFERALTQFMTHEKGTAWLRSVARNLLRILSQLRFTLELEAKLLKAPQREIERNLAAFRRKRVDMQRSGNDHQVLLEADARALLINEIQPALTKFKEQLKSRLAISVERWYGESKTLGSRELQGALEARLVAEVREAYDGWLAREDTRLRTAFESLCARAWSALQGAVDELMRYSSELFCVGFEPVRADARWTMESQFYYKFWYEPTSLKILATSAILALPKSIGGRLIVKRAQTRALELIESQSGRIRHDLEERLKKSVRDAHRQISETVESILERIEGAIDGGRDTRRRSEQHIAARDRELAEAILGAATVEARVRALVP